MRTLLIDDLRNIEADRVCRTFDDGIQALQNEGPWDELFLDHDYGDPDPHKNGEGIMKFLEVNPELLPGNIILVTANPVGRKRMEVIVNKLFKDRAINQALETIKTPELRAALEAQRDKK